MERVSTAGLNASVLQSALTVQARYAEKVAEQSSGLVAQTLGELGSKARDVVSLQTEGSQAQSYADNATTAYNRTQSMYSAVGSMVDLISDLRTALSSAISSTSTTTTLSISSQSTLQNLASLMNTKYDGIYVFAGSKTDTAPVNLDGYDVTSDITATNTGYYNGDDAIATVATSDQQSVAYGITGDCTAFEQALRVCAAAASMTNATTADLQQIYDQATQALNALEGTQGQISVNATRLEATKTQQESYVTFLQNAVGDLKNVDVATVASQVSGYETQLQASYAALASIHKLSLTSYL